MIEVDIIHLDAYKKMGLTKSELSPSILPLYDITCERMIPKGTIKLAGMVEEHLWESTMMREFLIVDYPSAVNGIIGSPLLKALKAVTSIYYLMMKFPTTEGAGQVRGSQYDSRECYNKSLKPAGKELNTATWTSSSLLSLGWGRGSPKRNGRSQNQ